MEIAPDIPAAYTAAPHQMAGLIARTGEGPVTLTHYRHRGVSAFRATVSLGRPNFSV